MPIRPSRFTLEIECTINSPSSGTPIICSFEYRLNDPYAVRVWFGDGKEEESAHWLFARDLLIHGQNVRCGIGDVIVEPSLDDEMVAMVVLTLRSPDGQAECWLPALPLADVVDYILSIVPQGKETDFQQMPDQMS